jgi:hypothetical protein
MTTPRDGYERYLTEKLWDWIPEIYRTEDGLADNPGVLRGLVESLGPALATARRSVDRLWEDQFAEFADDWALPYIGALVGTRLVNALNRRGRRADVARTIHYRRRKGTITVLELLIRDIAGWDGVVVESFRRLGRTVHRLDPPQVGPGATPAGRVTRTPPFGCADLRRVRGGDLVDGPFDEYSHAADVRLIRGFRGRYNIPKLNFHLYRRQPFAVHFATPVSLGANRYTIDPSGRDIDLFRPSQHGADECVRPVEWQLAAPIPCRLLAAARYALTAAGVPPALLPALTGILGVTFDSEARLRATLATLLTPAQFAVSIYPILAASILPDSPKFNLLGPALAFSLALDSTGAPTGDEFIVPANLGDWGATLNFATGLQIAVDPLRGRVLLLRALDPGAALFVPTYHVGLFGAVGATSSSRSDTVITSGVTHFPDGGLTVGPVAGFNLLPSGVQQFDNSKTYRPSTPAPGLLDNVTQLVMQAQDQERPYVILTPDGTGTFTFRAQPKLNPNDPAEVRELTLDGLWLGVIPPNLAPQAVAGPSVPATPVPTAIALDGVFDRVIVRRCTLDPGGEQARTVPTQVMPIPYVQLKIIGEVAQLIIEHSIVGPVAEAGTADPCSATALTITDSIVHSIDPAIDAIRTRIAGVDIERTTVFGDVTVDHLEASETLIQGLVEVTDNQHGCFRFSAANDGSSLPQQFESTLFAPQVPDYVFRSLRFGDSAFAQLSDSAPDTIARGAENRSEIGVFSALLTPIRQDDLSAKVFEFMPFGLIPQFINET